MQTATPTPEPPANITTTRRPVTVLRRAAATCRPLLWLLTVLVVVCAMPLQPAAAGSCREAQLCCSGRDSSCVVQKAPINAIIEDLSDKPCYCDHACLKLGDCCTDFKDHCGVRDCQVSAWGQWSECDASCGTGIMSRARKILQPAQNGGKHCPSLVQKRGCQGFRCHGYHDKRILHEMALLLPAALSRNRHANDSSDIRRNLRLRYRDLYKHNRKNEYCIEFEVIKATKACNKLPPYNLMLEGDRITARCDLEALIQDSTATTTATTAGHSKKNKKSANLKYKSATNKLLFKSTNYHYNKHYKMTNDTAIGIDERNADDDGDDDDDDGSNNSELDGGDTENLLDSGSYEADDYNRTVKAPAPITSIATTTTTATRTAGAGAVAAAATSFHCRGEGVSGRTTRWSALPSPSCRGKWLRLTVGAPKKCTHAQFIFV